MISQSSSMKARPSLAMEEENDVFMVEHPPPYQDEAPSSSAIVPPVQQVAPTMQQPFLRAGDVVLAVMGVTGAGKSTFVSLLSPDKDVEIGHDLRSRTKHVSVHAFRLSDGRQGWLMDTPGFDDTSRSDTEILREISSALTELYTRGVRLSGVLYLHRIVDPKMGHSAIRNLEIFKCLCGKEAMQGVAFVTTRWDGMEEGSPQWTSAVEREKQLRSSDKYWAGMIREGANVVRHFGTRTAALTVVDLLMQKQFGSPLAIQTELAKEMRTLDQTAAGRFLAQEQEELQARYAQEMKDLEQEREEALQQRDRVLAEELANQQQKYRAQHADFASVRQELHVDFQQMSKENAQQLVQTSQSSQQDSASTQQMKAQMDLIAQNVAEIQDEMERRDREHEEQIARLRKQARNRDKQHEAETIRLIEQMNVSHEHERKRSHRMMEILRKPRSDSRDRRDRYSDQRDHHRDRDREPHQPDGFTKSS